jgi:hypothetical protein
MNKKSLLLIEIVWIILGLMCLGIAVRETVTNGLGRAWLFFVMAAAAFVLSGIRDSQRKKR